MENNISSNQTHISSPDQSGAKIKSVYAERQVKVFAVHEPELKTVSYLNTAATTCFSIGAFFLSNVLKAKFSIQDTASQATIILFLIGIIATFFKRGIIKDIKDQSK